MAQVPLTDAVRTQFIEAALWHGNLEQANALLAAHPELASSDLHTAAILGDDAAVRAFIARDPASVTAKSPPYGGDALNYLGLSKYLRLEPERTPGFLRAAEALLDAGADPNTGFWTTGPHPEHETAMYGAAGVAHHDAMTRLLISRGADPNDGEVVYHTPESYDLGALKAVVETGRLTPESLALMLVRKHDWHDEEGVRYLLEHGADPNYHRPPGWQPLHHAIMRDNSAGIFELLLQHGADPSLVIKGRTGFALAAHHGRPDVLDLFERHGHPPIFVGTDRLIAACARGDGTLARELAAGHPDMLAELLSRGATLLANFVGTGNDAGAAVLLDLGVPVDARYPGDGYWTIPDHSTALHVAAWRAAHPAVRLLVSRGADVNALDGKGQTPLMLAVRACVDSYWAERRKPDSIEILLEHGATSYPEAERLLRGGGWTRQEPG